MSETEEAIQSEAKQADAPAGSEVEEPQADAGANADTKEQASEPKPETESSSVAQSATDNGIPLAELGGAGMQLAGHGTNNAINRAHITRAHREAVSRSPVYDDVIGDVSRQLPNLAEFLPKFKVGDRLVIDREYAKRLDAFIHDVRSEGGQVRFKPYNMVNALGYRLENGGIRPGVLLNTPHLLGRSADMEIAGVSGSSIRSISNRYGLGAVTPKDYAGTGFTHTDISMSDTRWARAYGNPIAAKGTFQPGGAWQGGGNYARSGAIGTSYGGGGGRGSSQGYSADERAAMVAAMAEMLGVSPEIAANLPPGFYIMAMFGTLFGTEDALENLREMALAMNDAQTNPVGVPVNLANAMRGYFGNQARGAQPEIVDMDRAPNPVSTRTLAIS